jgi:hypothetical protein
MPIRNPFRRAGGAEIVDENQRNAPGFENTTVAGAKPIEVKEPVEYKLSGMWGLPHSSVPRLCCVVLEAGVVFPTIAYNMSRDQ